MFDEYFEVSIDRIEVQPFDSNLSNNHGYTEADYNSYVLQLKDIQEKLEVNPKYFENSQLPNSERHLLNIYNQIYNPNQNQNIRLYWNDARGKYQIDSGRHRVNACLNMGLPKIYARVYAEDRQSLDRVMRLEELRNTNRTIERDESERLIPKNPTRKYRT